MKTLTWLLSCLALASACCFAGDAFEQNRKLGRGVNIIGYDPIWRARDQARFQEKHFRLLHEAGFNNVRINLHPFRQMRGPDFTLPPAWFETLDWAVTNALRNGLMPILDLHEYNALARDPDAKKPQFLAFWRQVAAHWADAPDTVLFEILNEPNKELTPEKWNRWLTEALRIIREKNPGRTVVVGPGFWNSIDHLHELSLPAEDRNLIVTVHYYKPMEFTHQGAAWAEFKDRQGVKWEATDAEKAALNRDLDKAAAWAKKENRPVLLGEFGAYDKAPMESRVRWTSAVARAAEARGWSWAYWQFDSDFVLYRIPQDEWNEPIKQALVPAK